MDSIRNINKEDFFALSNNSEKIKFLLNYAILAPSIYNSQPWLFKISENKCQIFLNPEINLKESDPEKRQLYISLGCAIENLIIAAKYFGVFESVNTIHEGENIVTEVHFVFNSASSGFSDNQPTVDKEYEKIVDFMPARQSVKGTFKKDSIPSDILSRLSMLVFLGDFNGLRVDFLTNKKQIESFAKLSSESIILGFKNSGFIKEKKTWSIGCHSSKREGIPKYAENISTIHRIISGIFPFISKGSFYAKANYITINSAQTVCIIGANENEQATNLKGNGAKESDKSVGTNIKTKQEIWIQAGRLAERLLLEFTARGFDTSIFSTVIEMGGLHKEIQKLVGMTERPQFVFCVGQAAKRQCYTKRNEPIHNLKSN